MEEGGGEQDMVQIEPEKYSAMIRGDYLEHLGGTKEERNRKIQQALKYFLGLPQKEKRREAEVQGVRLMRKGGTDPKYTMWLQIISLPDSLADCIMNSDLYVDADKILNAAIRLWIEKEDEEKLRI
jgi:hypothetical protein